MTNKKWTLLLLVLSMVTLLLAAGAVVVVDPYFHYHAPLPFLEYPLNSQRYQNDGIVRNFDYDAIITGTSMTENFKASQCDALFGVNSIKVPFSGGSYKEINDNLRRALEANPDTSLVIRGLDSVMLLQDKDYMEYPDYPEYLTDHNPFNDAEYTLSKHVLFEDVYTVVRNTLIGKPGTTFDEYSNWMGVHSFGKESILLTYSRPEKAEQEQPLTEEIVKTVTENVMQNVVSLAREYPQTQFYYFFPPYSIYHWDTQNQQGTIALQTQAHRLAVELMLQQENIHVYSFFTEFEMICNPDNYMDFGHYHEDISSQILIWLHEGHGLLTKENNDAHWQQVYDFYSTYDYETLF